MTNESTTLPKTKRIAGTLHKRGYVAQCPVQDDNLARELADECDVRGGQLQDLQKYPDRAR